MLADEYIPEEEFAQIHHRDGESFQQALDMGCQICTQSWYQLERPAALGRTTYHLTADKNAPEILGLTFAHVVGSDGSHSGSEESLSDSLQSFATVRSYDLRSKDLREDDRQPEHLQPEGSQPDVSHSEDYKSEDYNSEDHHSEDHKSEGSQSEHSQSEDDHAGFIFRPWSVEYAQMAAARLSNSTRSAQSFAFLTSKLANCRANHQDCSYSQISQYIPTRLLDVGGEGTKVIHLVSRDDVRANAEYATLSHCWGQAVSQKLTQSTEAMLRNEIAISNLPRTFQDAVEVSQKMRIPYLWIDSL